MTSEWVWIESSPDAVPDDQNMLFDEMLLNGVIDGTGQQAVRVYRWSSRCVSLGRHQSCNEGRAAYPNDRLYRRPTGGRAVLHGDDLIVTVAAREKSIRELAAKGGILASYHRILDGIVAAVTDYGITAVTGQEIKSASSPDCFESVGRCDVIDGESGLKILGAAQFRRHGAVLQQMSLRPHERYHIHDATFISGLKKHLADALAVNRWQAPSSINERGSVVASGRNEMEEGVGRG